MAEQPDLGAELERGFTAFKAAQWEEAIEVFGETLQLRVEAIGAEADECADLYFHYGAALFHRAQEESDVFGATVDSSVAQHGPNVSNGAGPSTEAGPSAVEDDKDPGDGSDNGDDGEDQEEEEADDDMQLAWENLEVAKTIYERDSASHKTRLTDIYTILADVAMEQENFESAVQDYRKAKELIEKEPSPSDVPDRRLAELCYKIGLALQFLQKPEDALKEVGNAIRICEGSVKSLDAASQEEPNSEEKKGLQSVLEDLKAKQEELKQAVEEMQKQKEMIQATFQKAFGAVNGGNSSTDIGQGSRAAFGSGSNTLQANSKVVDLGTVGQGRRRINLAPVSTNSVAPVAAPADSSKSKRTLDDLMGGPATSSEFTKPLLSTGNNVGGPAESAKRQCTEPVAKRQVEAHPLTGKENQPQEIRVSAVPSTSELKSVPETKSAE